LAECLRVLRTFGVHFLVGEVPLDDPTLEPLRLGGPGETWICRPPPPTAPPPPAATRRGARRPAATTRSGGCPGFATAGGAPGVATAEVAGGTVHIVEEKPEGLVLETDSAGEGLLVVNDSFFPGWLAYVDGVSTDIVRVNGLVRGVPVAQGKHRVVMRYA